MTNKTLRFAIFGNERKATEGERIKEIFDNLLHRTAAVYIEKTFYEVLPPTLKSDPRLAGVFEDDDFKADFVISLGGDGTFLKAASKVGTKRTPIIGINLGRLGFLANVSPEELSTTLDEIYAADFDIDERALIAVETEDGSLKGYPYALNDIAILKREDASMISIHVSVDKEYLTTYRADGLIISTPTGSTAYSLSNGGPIMIPRTGIMSLTPVAPHSLNIRPIVISDDTILKLEMESRNHSFLIAIDGRAERLKEGTALKIKKAPFKLRIVKRRNQSFFSTLRTKMMWGADMRKQELP